MDTLIRCSFDYMSPVNEKHSSLLGLELFLGYNGDEGSVRFRAQDNVRVNPSVRCLSASIGRRRDLRRPRFGFLR